MKSDIKYKLLREKEAIPELKLNYIHVK